MYVLFTKEGHREKVMMEIGTVMDPQKMEKEAVKNTKRQKLVYTLRSFVIVSLEFI